MWPVSELLPHTGHAILLDGVSRCDGDTLVARATVAPAGPYSLADGSLPPWAGLELMAQAVAAWAGWQARRASQPVQLGFLLGTRRYACHAAAFPAGMELAISATRTLQDASGMGVFECAVHAGGRLLAEARLNVYRPPDPDRYVQESPPHPSSEAS